MKVAIIGSRGLKVDISEYIPKGVTEIISGGATGIDKCANIFANSHNIKLTEFLPEYVRYGSNAPLKRNMQIVDEADLVIAFWDEKSRGSKYIIDYAKIQGKEVLVYIINKV